MTGPSTDSLAAWRKALGAMRPGNKIYKPAVLLVAIDLINQGATTPAKIPLKAVNGPFKALVGKIRSGNAAAKEPFIRLAGDGIWRVPEGEPRTDPVAAFTPQLAQALESGEGRAEVSKLIYDQLQSYGAPDANRLAEVHRA